MQRPLKFPGERGSSPFSGRQGLGIIMIPPSLEPAADAAKKLRLGRDFIEVCRLGFVERARDALAEGADVDSRDFYRRTAMMRAAFNGHVEVLRFLHDNRADVNAKDSEGWTALMYATFTCQTEAMEYLISIGADVNACNREGWTALSVAQRHVLHCDERHQRAIDVLKRNLAE